MGKLIYHTNSLKWCEIGARVSALPQVRALFQHKSLLLFTLLKIPFCCKSSSWGTISSINFWIKSPIVDKLDYVIFWVLYSSSFNEKTSDGDNKRGQKLHLPNSLLNPDHKWHSVSSSISLRTFTFKIPHCVHVLTPLWVIIQMDEATAVVLPSIRCRKCLAQTPIMWCTSFPYL